MKNIIFIIIAFLLISNVFAQEVLNFGTPLKMAAPINSASSELMPIFTNGKMYFTRLGYSKNKGGASAGMDIWYSDYNKTSKAWSEPKNDMGVLNTKGHNAVIGVSTDGNTIYLLNKYLKKDKSDVGISFSTKNGNEWTSPVNLEIPELGDLETVYGFFMRKNGKELIISYQSKKGKGLEDLYVSEQKEGKWTVPKSLGENINTKGYEMSPFLTDDGKTLYFSSNGHKGGFGGADIYMSKKIGDSWTSWSDPINLGEKINSAGFEGYFTKQESEDYFYFVRNNSTTKDDIYKVGIGEEELDVKLNFAKFVVAGLIFDEKTKEGLSLELTITDESKHKNIAMITSRKDGSYEVELDKGNLYTFNILTKGYHEHHDKVKTPKVSSTTTRMEYDLPMKKLEVGTKIDLGHIYFVVSLDSMREISLSEVDKLDKILKNNPNLKIRIEGHTDNSGLSNANQTLSEKRAKKIKELLVERGIRKGRLKTIGFGSTKSLVKNDTEEHRKQNRRVDFVIIE